jgi:hypothetical protein
MSGQKWWSRDADGMVHPDDSILLAYTRQQRLDQDWQDEIHQHIARCETCQKRCKELRQTCALLEGALFREARKWPSLSTDASKSKWDWVENPQSAQLVYQSRRRKRQREDLMLGIALLTRLPFVLLAKAVPALAPQMHKLLANERRPRNSAMAAIPVIGFPLAMFLVVLSVVIVFAYTVVMHNPSGANRPGGTATAKPQPTIQLTAHPTAVSTPSGKGTATTSTSSGRRPTISVCGSKNREQNRLYICGSGFKPGDSVELIINPNSSWVRMGYLVQVNDAGSFQTSLSINSCRDVPMSIIAQDVQHPSIVSQVLTNIPYSWRCFPDPIPTIAITHHLQGR